MVSCASSDMPALKLTQSWGSYKKPPNIKSEPVQEEPGKTSGSFSQGFPSASPSRSSKESNGLSPLSIESLGEAVPFYDNMPLKSKSNLGMHLRSYRSGLPYSLLTPPGFESNRSIEERESSSYESFSPRTIVHSHISSPLARNDATPPKSPPRSPSSLERENEGLSFDRFHDSGFDGVTQNKSDNDDGHEGSGLEDFDEEPGLRVPAVNSHGKVKTFKCKQCEFVAVTKLSFWKHSKEHIKPEKMLQCRKCPFVTEYKHHLEYHMRNHLGSKPFQCTQCSYSCVNKSMLNSHLKSHSNIYQYRCADCNYATKYCHSLKLHLRKYKHNPAMVLNMDGSPNPLPIIDVYGTRRGPKQKPLIKMFEQHLTHNNKAPQTGMPPHRLFGSHFPVSFPYLNQIMPQSFLFPPNHNFEQKSASSNEKEPLAEQRAMSPRSILQKRLSFVETSAESKTSPPRTQSPPDIPVTHRASGSELPSQTNDALDLTNTKSSEAGTPPPAERNTPMTPTTGLKNRRKGPAFKLQPVAMRLQHEDNKVESDASESESDVSGETPNSGTHNAHICQFCDITFGDLTMHTIHMGFHGFNDPFMCNKCGERSADRISFFIHLGLAQHV